MIVMGMYIPFLLLIFKPVIPPNIRKIERVFSRNYESFCVVTEFLTENDAQSIIIINPDGTMQADFAKKRIADQEVLRALVDLFSLRPNMRIYKSYDTIQFHWWSHWIADIEGYMAYSENQTRGPDVLYATQIMPLEETGWYYVISDYDQWRVEK